MAPQPPPTTPDNGESSSASNPNDGGVVMRCLPEDMIHEILLRLPAKPLCRLRTVCRSWRSLTSNPSFIAAHKARHGPLLAVRRVRDNYYDDDDDDRPVDVCILDKSGHIVRQIQVENYAGNHFSEVSCSSLDIFCFPGADRRLHVLDPAAGAVSLLPQYRIPDVDHGSRHTTFAVGRAASSTKVLGITEGEYQQLQRSMVLTLGDADAGEWRETGSPQILVMAIPRYVALAKGVIYFWGSHAIAAYDLGTERWRPDLLHTPPSIAGEQVELAELSDSLVAVYNGDKHGGGIFLDLWFLTDCEKALWSKQYTIAMPNLGCRIPCDSGVQPLWMLDDGKIVLSVWQYSWDRKTQMELLRVYDPKTNTCTCSGADMLHYNIIGVYKGSLLGSSIHQELSRYPITV